MNKPLIIITIMLALATAFCCCACSKQSNPIIPESEMDTTPLISAPDEEQSNRELLGIWDVEFDLKSMSAKIEPDRSTASHLLVTQYLPAPGIVVYSYNGATQVVDVDVTIVNPYSINVFDLRLIVYDDSIGHKLLNPDAYTTLFDIPEGDVINPFKAYARGVPNRMFAGHTQHAESLQVHLPGNNPSVKLGISASYPENCLEPYAIEYDEPEIMFTQQGSYIKLEVQALDWQYNVERVFFYCPDLMGSSLIEMTKNIGMWETSVENSDGVWIGDYQGIIMALSPDAMYLPLYKKVKLRVGRWVIGWGGEGYNWPRAMENDDDGNIYIAGTFMGINDFDPGPGEDLLYPGARWGMFLMKLDADGIYQWGKSWGGTTTTYGDDCLGMTLDSFGNIYMIGKFRETVNFNPDGDPWDLTSNGEVDIFVTKFDENGDHVWALAFGGENYDFGYGIDVDSSGNVYASGSFNGTVDFDPGPEEDIHEAEGIAAHSFISKFNSSGAHTWTKTFGGDATTDSRELCISSSNIFITGHFTSYVDFNPGPGTAYSLSNGSYDVFLGAYDLNGNYITSKTWGGPGYDEGYSMTLDNSGNIYVVGQFSESVDLDPGAGEEIHISNGNRDVYLSKFLPTGVFQWTRTWGGASLDINNDVTCDDFNNVHCTGYFESSVDFDPGPGEDIHIGGGSGTFMQVKYSASGEYQWVKTSQNSVYSQGYSIVSPDSGITYLVGFCDQLTDFDLGPCIVYSGLDDSGFFLYRVQE